MRFSKRAGYSLAYGLQRLQAAPRNRISKLPRGVGGAVVGAEVRLADAELVDLLFQVKLSHRNCQLGVARRCQGVGLEDGGRDSTRFDVIGIQRSGDSPSTPSRRRMNAARVG